MKKIKIIGVFVIFALAFISHFMYDWFSNGLFSILFPVNESIWEHMKLMATPVLLFSLFEYFIYRRKGISYNNFLLSYGVSIILGIVIYLAIYLPIEALVGHNMFISIGILLAVYAIMQLISYFIMNYNEIRGNKILGIVLILLLYLLFFYFTYYPPINDLFYDSQKHGYGILD